MPETRLTRKRAPLETARKRAILGTIFEIGDLCDVILDHLKIQDGVPLLKTSKRFYYGTPERAISDTRVMVTVGRMATYCTPGAQVPVGTAWVLRRADEHTRPKMLAVIAACMSAIEASEAFDAASKAWDAVIAEDDEDATLTAITELARAQNEAHAAHKVASEARKKAESVMSAVFNSGVYKRAYVAAFNEDPPPHVEDPKEPIAMRLRSRGSM